jgi:hypothetical protein
MPEVSSSKYLVMAGWEDVPHLDAKTKQELWDSTPPHLRHARSRGIPVLGSGQVFPVGEDEITCAPFPIPDHWPQLGGMDFGWDHPFATARIAWDRDKDTIYVTQDYRHREMTPIMAKAALETWDLDWLPWAWPHDGLQHDKGSGEELASQYEERGFNMLSERATFPDGSNGLEAGIMQMLERMQLGRWKVFKTCTLWLEEFRTYHRKDGLIVKKADDVISASRYAYMMRRYAVIRKTTRSLKINKSWRTA